MLSVGDRVWAPHEEQSWVAGRITAIDATKALTIDTEFGKLTVAGADASKLEACGSHIDQDIINLVDLDEMSEGAILHHVRKRFKDKKIYTHVGNILVAVNPFERLDIYGSDQVQLHLKVTDPAFATPHVYATGAAAYRQLQATLKNQAVLISGESGAGKTETTKKVLSFLAAVASAPGTSSSEPGIEEKILQSNPLLESLGNAKTLRNDNSSRFGKWMKVDINKYFKIQGCEIVNYLLEKSRVVKQSPNERNYHIFYFLLEGATAEMKRDLSLGATLDYNFLSQSGCTKINNVDDAKEFADVVGAMQTLNFSQETQNAMFSIISAILHLGNVHFVSGGAEGSRISPASSVPLTTVARLLGVNLDSLTYCLTQKNVQMGKGSMVAMKLSPEQALDGRDTLAKALFSNMFDWTIQKVNENLVCGPAPYSIGILDIFGFEVFEINSFEQLCINYSNEKLQLHFNTVVFETEMGMYKEEEVPTDKVDYRDNSKCVELIEGKPFSLMGLLEEECALGNASDTSYANKIEATFGKGKKYENAYFAKNKTRPELFAVRHFAGPVEYNVTNFLDKNRDTMSQTTRETMLTSTFPLIVKLFEEVADPGGKEKKGGKIGLGGQFRNQLIGLVTGLKTQEAHFIRCVKPNMPKRPGFFESPLALRQLRYAGLFEAISIRKSGYAYRASHEAFSRYYSILVDGLQDRLAAGSVKAKDGAKLILERATANNLFPSDVWQIGKTKVFMKTNDMNVLLDRQRSLRCVKFAIKIQAIVRGALIRTRYCGERQAKIAEKKLKAEMEAKARVEAIRKANLINHSVIVIQKMTRKFLVTLAMRSVKELLKLRSALAMKNMPVAVKLIAKMESSSLPPPGLMPKFTKELFLAKTIIQVVRLQNQLEKDLQMALDVMDVRTIQALLLQSDSLDMSDNPIVLRARNELGSILRRKRVMVDLCEFLQNENDHFDTVLDTIRLAKEENVDADFIAKVERVYDSTVPRMKARNSLRQGIEVVHENLLNESLQNALDIQRSYPSFAETEIRAGKNLLKLMHFEQELMRAEDLHLINPRVPRLTSTMIQLRQDMMSTSDKDKRLEIKRKLRALCKSDIHFEVVVRALKWSKIMAVWLYPEVLKSLQKSASDGLEELTLDDLEEKEVVTESGDFFGLRAEKARSTLHITRSLHKDFDLSTGEAPPSMQAAAGAMNLPAAVKEKLDEITKKASFITSPETKSSHEKPKGKTLSKSSSRMKLKDDVIIDTKTVKPRTSFALLPKAVEDQLHDSRSNLELLRKKNAFLKQSIAPNPIAKKNTWK